MMFATHDQLITFHMDVSNELYLLLVTFLLADELDFLILRLDRTQLALLSLSHQLSDRLIQPTQAQTQQHDFEKDGKLCGMPKMST